MTRKQKLKLIELGFEYDDYYDEYTFDTLTFDIKVNSYGTVDIRIWKNNIGNVQLITYTPDGKRIISCNQENIIKFMIKNYLER